MGFDAPINQMLYSFYGVEGAVGDTLNERESSWLALKGFSDKTLSEQWASYRKQAGGFPTLHSVLLIDNSLLLVDAFPILFKER
jgi:hypothetical protein